MIAPFQLLIRCMLARMAVRTLEIMEAGVGKVFRDACDSPSLIDLIREAQVMPIEQLALVMFRVGWRAATGEGQYVDEPHPSTRPADSVLH